MWYEIIPGFLIVVASIAAPTYLFYPMNWLVTGHFYRRSLMDKHEALQYLRDGRLEDPYKVLGLENIPDEEETEKKEETVKKEETETKEETEKKEESEQ